MSLEGRIHTTISGLTLEINKELCELEMSPYISYTIFYEAPVLRLSQSHNA